MSVGRLRAALDLLAGDRTAGRVVPPSGFTVRLTVLSAAAMAFLAVFALALTLATDRVATRWAGALDRTATLRLATLPEEGADPTATALAVLETTPGIAAARPLSEAERRALLEPWVGPDFPVPARDLPVLIEVTETAEGPDHAGLAARLAGELPGATYDTHDRWRRPLVQAAGRLRAVGLFSLGLIAVAMAASVALAAQAALSANARVIATLRLLGALDRQIARAFVRRFTLRALAGAAAGTTAGLLAIAALPDAGPDGFLTGLGFAGLQWLLPLLIPPAAALAGFAATRIAAFRQLQETR